MLKVNDDFVHTIRSPSLTIKFDNLCELTSIFSSIIDNSKKSGNHVFYYLPEIIFFIN